MNLDKTAITVSKRSDLRMLDMVRRRVAAELEIDPDGLGNIEAWRWVALEYLDDAPPEPATTDGLRVELNGATPVLLAALRASGEEDTAEAFETVAADYVARHVDLPDANGCGHMEDYQTSDGCLRCFDEKHREEDRQLVADLVDEPEVKA